MRRNRATNEQHNAATVRNAVCDAGVGIATVSRALNGVTQGSPGTQEKVNLTIRRLGFQHNTQARRIHHSRAQRGCILLSNRTVLNPFHPRRRQGVEDCACEIRQHVLTALPPFAMLRQLLLSVLNYRPSRRDADCLTAWVLHRFNHQHATGGRQPTSIRMYFPIPVGEAIRARKETCNDDR